ncbi:hypothetical protein PR202_ga11583 [Eleusine coracana subsp. coracana]|uniref:Bidirectional sugar transporter SWEET n=1 Tax=Eleusine coracana subsp. coracana TaxID=191504 RepID=A0AAV5C9Y8_ELECO|nr:hypothetical protein PR202_ga11583 [Eleusine coracana subsp. coracana]
MVTSLRVIVGIIGNAVCALLYAAPILTFKRVIKEASVGEFSCIPYILSFFSALIWTWYGLPVVSAGWENLTVASISAIGILFEFSFIIIYIWFAPRDKKKFVVLMVTLVLAIVGVTVFFSSFTIHGHHMRKLFVGSMGIVTSMSMYSSPLVAVFNLDDIWYPGKGSLSHAICFLLKSPNCIGCFTGTLQLVVYCIYSRCKKDEPPKTLNDVEKANNMEFITIREDSNEYKP